MAVKRLDRLIRAMESCIRGFMEQNYLKYYKLACVAHSDNQKIFDKTLELVRAREQRAKYEYYLWVKESFRSSYKYHRCNDLEELIGLLPRLESAKREIKKYLKQLDQLAVVSDDNIKETVDHMPYTKLCEVVNEVNKLLCAKERDMRHKRTGYSSLSQRISSDIIDNNKINIDALNHAFWVKIKVKVALINKNRNEFYNNKVVNPAKEERDMHAIALNQQLEMSREEVATLKLEVASYQSIVMGM